ncbi:hypothetical protein [Okeania sp. SIO3B5]|uniref:hypothetical protein n=1 Tax=Okeania sp. SIO3B5 TaxID=2607811 RepID=UPI0025E3D79F|nr:hypothetical protein [Okeania sp. SIO3B5]
MVERVWGDGEMGGWGDGEIGRWGDWEIERLGDGEIGRWGDWGIGSVGEIKKYISSTITMQDYQLFLLRGQGLRVLRGLLRLPCIISRYI